MGNRTKRYWMIWSTPTDMTKDYYPQWTVRHFYKEIWIISLNEDYIYSTWKFEININKYFERKIIQLGQRDCNSSQPCTYNFLERLGESYGFCWKLCIINKNLNIWYENKITTFLIELQVNHCCSLLQTYYALCLSHPLILTMQFLKIKTGTINVRINHNHTSSINFTTFKWMSEIQYFPH